MGKKYKNNGNPIQWKTTFPQDVEETLLKMKEGLRLKANSDLIEHIVTIYLAERRLIP